MTSTLHPPKDPSYTDVADLFLSLCRQGTTPSIREFVREFPQFAAAITEEFPAMLLAETLKGDFFESAEEWTVPTTISGYKLRGELGRGGMGRVYSAFHGLWNKEVAIKVVSLENSVRPGMIARFRREARTAGTLKHPNIVPVLDYGTQDNVAFIVMPRIKGHTLVRVIEEVSKAAELAGTSHTPIDWEMLADIGIQVSSALKYAHSRGLIHRDIKPGNIMVDHTGKIWIMDFGLVKMIGQSEHNSTTGHLAGTPRYMAPEQFRGCCDCRTDIYGLGLTLYELACGTRVWDFMNSEGFYQHRSQLALPAIREINPTIPEEIDRIIMKCCEFDPVDRYQSADELHFVLERFLAGRGDRRRTKNRERKFWKRRTFLATSAFLSLSLAVGVSYGLYRLSIPPNPFDDPQSAIKVLKDENIRSEFMKELPGLLEEVVTNDDPEYRKIVGDLANRTFRESVEQADLPEQEKNRIKENIDKWVNQYKSGEFSNERLAALWTNLAGSSVASAMRFTRIYAQVFQSDLSEQEKFRAQQWMLLLRQSIIEKRLTNEGIGRLVDCISALEAAHGAVDGSIDYPEFTPDELREFLTKAQKELEAIGGFVRDVPLTNRDIHVADAIEKTVQQVLLSPQGERLEADLRRLGEQLSNSRGGQP